jgi:hypothetical protein
MLRSMSSRVLPVPGQRVEVVHLGRREPAVVVRVEGPSVWVHVEGEKDEQRFDLHPVTAHFVRHGEPYWGTRLALGHSDVP